MTTVHFPPTLIVVHEKERRSKCTVEPLRGKPGFVFQKFPLRQRPDVQGYVRLALDGPLLSEADAASGLLVLDATWRLAERMEREFVDVPTRSLPPLRTAYPRVSKLFDDPAPGLSTIEAVYAAYVLLGRPIEGLLDDYRWRDAFLNLNGHLFDASAGA